LPNNAGKYPLPERERGTTTNICYNISVSKLAWISGFITCGIIIAIFAAFPLYSSDYLDFTLIMYGSLFLFLLAIPILMFLRGKQYPTASLIGNILIALYWLAIPTVVAIFLLIILFLTTFE